eukprot:1279088-Prymnesium_polylepis.1
MVDVPGSVQSGAVSRANLCEHSPLHVPGPLTPVCEARTSPDVATLLLPETSTGEPELPEVAFERSLAAS